VSHPWRTRRSREKEQGDVVIIHQTVRCCTKLSGEPTAPVPTVGCMINARHVARSNGRLGASDCPVCTGQCPVRHLAQRSNGSVVPDLEGNLAPDMLQWLSSDAPDCPVRHSTEGKDSLPC
jgi:hypothetical protein